MKNVLPRDQARQIWLHAQKLETPEPFGHGPQATQAAIEHLGYVQIDTINVIERCHHHILFNRIPRYRRKDLYQAQALDKTVFEYWTHALSYVPTRDYRFFRREMNRVKKTPSAWFRTVKEEELQKVLRLIKKDGALSIRDIEDDVLVEKTHPWASMKPSKKALQLGFYTGRLVVSERVGMLKKYELTDRHFEWDEKPAMASEKEILQYHLDRALRSQGVISADSICYLNAPLKPGIKKLLLEQEKKGLLVPVTLPDEEKTQLWVRPEDLEQDWQPAQAITHVLSPFDPLVIQRKRLKSFFGYEHRFEAYLPKDKRVFGYFALPVLLDDRIVAAVDLKTDRQNQRLLIQKWTWLGKNKSTTNKK